MLICPFLWIWRGDKHQSPFCALSISIAWRLGAKASLAKCVKISQSHFYISVPVQNETNKRGSVWGVDGIISILSLLQTEAGSQSSHYFRSLCSAKLGTLWFWLQRYSTERGAWEWYQPPFSLSARKQISVFAGISNYSFNRKQNNHLWHFRSLPFWNPILLASSHHWDVCRPPLRACSSPNGSSPNDGGCC